MAGLAAAMLLIAAGGCGWPQATIRYVGGGPDETVHYDLTVYQLAKDVKVQVVLYHRTAAPVGDADPDFEYVFFELPEQAEFSWIKDDGVPMYRWVRQNGRNTVWRGTSGRSRVMPSIDKTHMHFIFQVTMEPVAGTPGGAYVLNGDVRCAEDMIATQSLIRRYGEWLMTILGEPPKPPPEPMKVHVGSKKSSPAKKP